jgi:hypothetical protein
MPLGSQVLRDTYRFSVTKTQFLHWRTGRTVNFSLLLLNDVFESNTLPADFLEKCVNSGFRHSVNEIFALLRCYAALIGNLLPTFLDNLSVLSSRDCMALPVCTALHTKRTQISFMVKFNKLVYCIPLVAAFRQYACSSYTV